HALPDHLGRTPHRLVVGARHRLARDPLGAGYLVGLVEPAEMKHRLVAPFVGILLDERRQERERRIRRMDRRLRMARFERFDDRGGVLHRGAVRREHERDQRQTGMALELFEGARVTHHPGVRDLLVAEVRAHLHRVGRELRAEESQCGGHGSAPYTGTDGGVTGRLTAGSDRRSPQCRPRVAAGLRMRLADLDYALPPELVAQEPPAERSDARLLVLDRVTGIRRHGAIGELPELLRAGDLLVLNDTRVIPARVYGRRPSGGRLELPLVRPLEDADGAWEV